MSGAEFQEREAELLTVGARRHDVVNIEEGWNHLLIPLLCLRDLEFRVGVSAKCVRPPLNHARRIYPGQALVKSILNSGAS